MKNLIKVMFLGIALFVMNGMTQAQVKIAHVNTTEVLEALPEHAKAAKDLEKYYGDLQGQLQTMAQEYQSKVQDYEANQATMNNLVKQSKEKEINDLGNRIQQFQNNAAQELEAKSEELQKPIVDKVKKAIDAVAKEKGFTYVFDSSIPVYIGTDAVDITKDVKSKLGIK